MRHVDVNVDTRKGSVVVIYSRELEKDPKLGAYVRSALQEYCKHVFADYYKGDLDVDGKRISLFEVDGWYLPQNVLGMTDGFSAIWIRNDLEKFGYGLRKRVLEHEKEHVRDPTADEMTVRKRTNTVSLQPYSTN